LRASNVNHTVNEHTANKLAETDSPAAIRKCYRKCPKVSSPAVINTQKQLLLSARLSHRNSVYLSVCHTGGSFKNDAS